MGQHIIGHGDQGILFAEHGSIFADEGQTVHIGIDHNTQIGLLGRNAG